MPTADVTTADVIIAVPSLLYLNFRGRTAVVNLAMVISGPSAVDEALASLLVVAESSKTLKYTAPFHAKSIFYFDALGTLRHSLN